ncbi:helix-turn-helix transcriptional regulator [Nocardioides dongxiaopingii]|uniref:helix-turn-helix domain-containing protein n=1 Tax=Nocardioides sp. S-1144 TaxID=2582905 RepID=UPI00110D9902|nr:helix-turn-helix transcriptional regulator [Nocardioides sp. S-1144]QCW49292.1 helix-turn-helix transcriptional regulator [Nocardioides sp. S-1144]
MLVGSAEFLELPRQGRVEEREPVVVRMVSADDEDLLRPFLEREREALDLVVSGLANHEIAERLEVPQAMIKELLNRAYRKLGVRTRAHAIVTWGRRRRVAPDRSPRPVLEVHPVHPRRAAVPDDGPVAGAGERRSAGWAAQVHVVAPSRPTARAPSQMSPIPPMLATAALAKVIGQDLDQRTWANPREAQLTENPWPAPGDPMVLFLVHQAAAAIEAGADLCDTVRGLAVRAWFEGGVESYDQGQRDARRPRSS